MKDKDIKWLEDKSDEYFEERNRLIKRKERYEKRGKDIPKNLDKRISECFALYIFYKGLITQSIEAELNMAQKRQEAEIRRSLGVRDCDIMPFGFNSFYGMSPFIR